MDIDIIKRLIINTFHDDVSDIKIIVDDINNNQIIHCVCYGTIPMECWLVHNHLEIDYGTFGILKGCGNNLSPREFSDYETYLFKYAELLLQEFKTLCLNILPDKYLNLYHGGFDVERYQIICSDFDAPLQDILQDVFASDVSNICYVNNEISFIMHETICFVVKIETERITLIRQLIRDHSVILLERNNSKESLEFLFKYIRAYSDCIIPDEWLLSFSIK